MKIEEAIKQFKEWEGSGWSKSETPNSMALVTAISALEKQIPTPPVLKVHEKHKALGKNLNSSVMKERDIGLKWIPFEVEYDEKEELNLLQGEVPENEQEILATDGKTVWMDTFIRESECYLDSGEILVSDVVAWMPLPKPYLRKWLLGGTE